MEIRVDMLYQVAERSAMSAVVALKYVRSFLEENISTSFI
jgi:hypothetical protein